MDNTEIGKAGSVNSEELSPSPSNRKQPVDQKGENEEPLESGGNSGKSSEVSPVRQRSSGQRHQEAKDSRQKESRHSSDSSSSTHHNRRGQLEKERRASPPPARERGKDKRESTSAKQHGARDSRHSKPPVKDRRDHLRSTIRTIKHRHPGDTLASPYYSLKRHRQHSPEASSSRSLSPLSRVITRIGALEVALEDLQVPGGAFLPVPSSSTEPTVSQRAWLTWQLSHAGAALHWALYTVNCILAAQAWMPRHT